MKNILLACFFCLACLTTQAQNKKVIDSLMRVYSTAKHDTIKINILDNIAYEYGSNNPDTAIVISKKILLKSEKIGFEKGKGYAWKSIGQSYLFKGQNDKAIFYFEKALPIFQKIKDLNGLAVVYGSLGVIYNNQGDYPKALEYLHKDLALGEQRGDKAGIAATLINIGVNYFERKDYPKALEYFQKSLTIAEALHTKYAETLISTSLVNIGDAYAKLGNDSKALEYYQKSLEMAKKLGSKYATGYILNSLGDIYIKQKKYKEALASFEESLKIAEETGIGYIKTVSLRGLGKVYQKTLDYEKSIEYVDKALQAARQINALAEAKSANEVLFESYELKGDFANALKYHKLYKQTNDSLFNDEKNKAVSSLESKAAKAEIEKKELQIQEEKKAKQFQTYILYLVGAGLVSVIIFAFYVYRSRQKEKKAKEAIAEQKEEISQMNEELNTTLTIVEQERQKSDKLLLNILPTEVANELKETGKTEVKYFESVTVLFADVKGFSALATKISPQELIGQLDETFTKMDEISMRFGLERIKTIGDCYMACGGLPEANQTHPFDVILTALNIQHWMNEERERRQGNFWQVRLGLHTGDAVAGVIGKTKFAYDIWGNTVNLASRMESGGEVGKVNVTQQTFEIVKDYFEGDYREEIEAKNIGKVRAYFIDRLKPEFSKDELGFEPNERFWEKYRNL